MKLQIKTKLRSVKQLATVLLVITCHDSFSRMIPENFLTTSTRHNCAIVSEGIHCWGNQESKELLDFPSLYNPYMVSAGSLHTCALDDQGVKCWGNNSSGQLNVPPLNNPYMISAGSRHTCAIDDDGVKCWGSNYDGQNNVPTLNNPRMISAGSGHTCALDDDGVKCWGCNLFDQSNVPSLNNPSMISAGSFHTCAIDNDGVKCWGDWGDFEGNLDIPSFNNPRMISAGSEHTCALDDDGVKCWGRGEYGQTNVPQLNNPHVISGGTDYTCAIDDDGVKCWGNNEFVQADVPKLTFNQEKFLFRITLSTLDYFLKDLTKYVYSFDRGFINGLRKIATSQLSKQDTLFFSEAISNYIGNLDYPEIKGDIDEYNETLENMKNHPQYAAKFSFEHNIKARFKIVLHILITSYKTAMKLLNQRQKKIASEHIIEMSNFLAAERTSLKDIALFIETLDSFTELSLELLESPYLAPRGKLQLQMLKNLQTL